MKSKITISARDCQPGMKIGQTVFNNYGAVIVSEDSILDEHMIRKLQQFDIDRILIYPMSDAKIEENSEKFKQQYTEHVDVVKDVIKEIGDGKDVNAEKTNVVVNSIMESVKENRDIIYCINQVRGANEYTYNHCMNVSLLSMMIAKWVNFPTKKIKELVYAGLLHDIGKARVDQEILNKPAKLTIEEFEEMKKHVIHGYRLIENMPGISKDIAVGVLMHHEREDGSGYMLGAKGSQIHPYAKIIAIADVYDAMTSNRVYREKESPFEVFESINSGTFGKFETTTVMTFLNRIANYYVGDMCMLSTGEIAEIVYINPNNISKPLVKVDNIYLDLSKEQNIKVKELIRS